MASRCGRQSAPGEDDWGSAHGRTPLTARSPGSGFPSADRRRRPPRPCIPPAARRPPLRRGGRRAGPAFTGRFTAAVAVDDGDGAGPPASVTSALDRHGQPVPALGRRCGDRRTARAAARPPPGGTRARHGVVSPSTSAPMKTTVPRAGRRRRRRRSHGLAGTHLCRLRSSRYDRRDHEAVEIDDLGQERRSDRRRHPAGRSP